jgi:hypothetical protein
MGSRGPWRPYNVVRSPARRMGAAVVRHARMMSSPAFEVVAFTLLSRYLVRAVQKGPGVAESGVAGLVGSA